MLWILFLYLIAFPFGQLVSYQLLSTARVHLVDVLASLFLLCWVAEILWRRKKVHALFARPFLSFLGFAAFTWMVGSVGLSVKSSVVGFLYLARLALYSLFYIGIADLVRRDTNKDRAQKIYDSLIVVGTFIALGGIVGYLLFPDTRALSEYGWDNHYYRLIGTLLDPAFTGALLVLFLVLVLCRRWQGINERVIGTAIFGLGWVALALTYSRASYVGVVAAFVVFFLLRRNLKLLVAEVVLTALTLILLPHPYMSAGTNLARTQTITARVTNYEGAFEGLKNPALGVGYNLWQGTTSDPSGKITHSGSGIHSSLLFVLTTTGAGGLLIYLGLLSRIGIVGWQKRSTTIGLALLCSSAGLLANSLFDNSLFYPWVMGWMAILLAIQEV